MLFKADNRRRRKKMLKLLSCVFISGRSKKRECEKCVKKDQPGDKVRRKIETLFSPAILVKKYLNV